MRRLASLAIAVVVGFLSDVLFAAPIEYREQYDLDRKESSKSGKAVLKLSTNVIVVGETYFIDYLFINTGTTVTVFNPYLSTLNDLPVVLVMYDQNHKAVADLWPAALRRGSRSDSGQWVSVPRYGQIGVQKEFHVDDFWKLSPGKYYVQLVFLRGFLDTTAYRKDENYVTYNSDKFDRNELFRANTVEVMIVTTNAPASQP